MAYALLDDQLTDHPKFLAVGPVAGWLYVCGLTYCCRLLTDGFIPAAQVRRLADVSADDVDALVTRLVDARLWEETAGGYCVHDYLEHNPSAAEVRERRARTAERQARWRGSRLAPSIKEGTNAVSHASRNASRNASSNAVSHSAPSHPTIDSSVPYGTVPDAPSAPAEPTRKAMAAAARQPAQRTQAAPKPQGVSLTPLADAFAARGLEFPSPKSGREVQAVQALLRRAAPEQIAACWAAICEGDYGSDFDQKRLSFCHLEGQRFIDNWLAVANGRMRPPKRPAGGGTGHEPRGADALLAMALTDERREQRERTEHGRYLPGH